MNNLAKVIALGGRRLNRALAMHYLFSEQGIPKGYIPLAYIKSTGTQWINTGVTLTEYTYDGNLMFTEVPVDDIATVFGAQLSAAPWNEKSVTAQNGKWRLYAYRGADSSIVSVGGTVVANKDYHISGQHKSGDIRLTVNRGLDDEMNVTNTASYNVNDNPIGIFAMYNSGRGAMYAKMRLYNLSFSTFDGELVRDYKPCISPDGKVGLYDLVDRKFYGNNGTGEFIAGYGIDNYIHDGIISFTDAEWGLDGSTLKNLAGDNYDMTITGSLPYADKGLTFNGANNYINVPEFTELANTAEVTFEMVMNLTNIQSTQRVLFLQHFFEFYISSRKLHTDFHFDGTPIEQLIGNANTGFITFEAVFKANEFQKLFINGVQVASTSATSPPSSVPISGTISNNKYPLANGSKFYNMRVYKRALTNEEIAQNFEIDKARFVPTETASVMSMADETDAEVTEDDTI